MAPCVLVSNCPWVDPGCRTIGFKRVCWRWWHKQHTTERTDKERRQEQRKHRTNAQGFSQLYLMHGVYLYVQHYTETDIKTPVVYGAAAGYEATLGRHRMVQCFDSGIMNLKL